MVKILCMLWSAVITSGWWAFGYVIDISLSEWHSFFCLFFLLFCLANVVTVVCIIGVTVMFIMELCEKWNQ